MLFSVRSAMLWVMLTIVHTQYQFSSHFVTYQVELWSRTDSIKPSGVYYYFNQSWDQTYSDITASSIIWGGYKIQTPGVRLSFHVTYSPYTTYCTIGYLPHSNSQIVFAIFSVLLVRSGQGFFEMSSIDLNPTIISVAPRLSNLEIITYPSVFNFTDTTDYETAIFLKYFICSGVPATQTQELKVQFSGYNVNTNIFLITCYSNLNTLTTFSNIGIVYIIVKKSAFSGKLIVHKTGMNDFSGSSNFTTNFGAPTCFSLGFFRKCAIGITYDSLLATANKPAEASYSHTTTGNTTTILNLNSINHFQIGYTAFCIMQCDSSHFFSGSTCVLCSASRLNCLTCTSSVCLTCATYFYVDVTYMCAMNCSITNCAKCVVVGPDLHCQICNSYYLSNNTHCNSVCGDGFWVTEEICEDGNLVDDDGCSSLCVFQPRFYCVLNPTNISTCYACSTNCQNCTSSTICTVCDLNAYELISATNSLLCYLDCPLGYYADNSTRKCLKCMSDCFECLNFSSCSRCIIGVPVPGGCSSTVGCSAAQYNLSLGKSLCIACEIQFFLSGRACVCLNGFRMVTHHCTDVEGCTSARRIGNDTVCIACNLTQLLLLVGRVCQCIDGFEWNEVQQCTDICGDGRVFLQKCDDGNNLNGDGCSSVCEVENKYVCRNGSQTHASECVYTAKNLALKFVSADKVEEANRAIFKFEISPAIHNLEKLNLLSSARFECQQRAVAVEYAYDRGTVTVEVDFEEDLQGSPASFTLALDQSLFFQGPLSVSFRMVSRSSELRVVRNYYTIKMLDYFFMAVGAAALLLFVAGSLAHRMIGVETLHTFHAILLLHFNSSNFSETFYQIRFLAAAAGNFRIALNQASNWYHASNAFLFDEQNKEDTAAVALGLIGASLLLYSIIKTAKLCVSSQQAKPKIRKIVQKMDELAAFSYDFCFFPSVIGFLLTNTWLMIGTINGQLLPIFDAHPKFSSFCRTFLVAVSSLVFFSEWKRTLVKPAGATPALPRCRPEYVPTYLSFALVLNVLLAIGFKQILAYCREAVLATTLLFLAWFACTLPYDWKIHNTAQVFNLAVVALFAGWTVARDRFPALQAEETEIFLMLIFIGLLLTVLILTTVRTVIEIRFRLQIPVNSLIGQAKTEDRKASEAKCAEKGQKMRDLLSGANPYNILTIQQKEKMAEMDECNRTRLMNDVDLLYFQKQVQQKLRITNRKRLKTASKMDKKLQELKSKLKQEFTARKLFLERRTRDNQ